MSRTLTIALLICSFGCSDYDLSVLASDPPPELDGEEQSPDDEVPIDAPEESDPGEEEEEEGPPPEEPPPADDCEGTSDLVYAIDRDTENLYLFDPEELSFELVGTLDCGLWAGSPASMSVSRDGYAYVRYADDTVYAVNLETMHCSETSYGSGFGHFGMGFATDSADSWQDDLYVANDNQLARLNTNNWNLDTIGGLPSQSELTGNADGELWAILPLETPARLIRLDKENAQVIETRNLPSFPDPYVIDTFAFAMWGGDFWIFVRTYGLGSTTDVYRVSPNGNLTLVWADSGLTVVGAGVSTCAPTD